jgi:hypothetical protein
MYVSQHHCRSTDRFNELYVDSTARAIRKDKAKELQSQSFGFKPQINKVSEYIVNGVGFEERLKKYNYDRVVKQEKVKR